MRTLKIVKGSVGKTNGDIFVLSLSKSTLEKQSTLNVEAGYSFLNLNSIN
jgi:hypothetical protein